MMHWNEYIRREYEKSLYAERSDIKEHLPILASLATECGHVTEMGSRFGDSTRAFLSTHAVFRAYDLELVDNVKELFLNAKHAGKDVEYIQADTRDLEIEETDLLFIDTWHSGDQLAQELKLHGNKARKYLAFHDTQTYGLMDESWDKQRKIFPGEGLLPAIIDFMIKNKHWQFKMHRTNNNGLTVLERV
jgi:trans-aconitate methyltransferase